MGEVTPAQLQQANAKAAAAQEATRLIQQAGNGLAEVFAECKANAAGIETAVKIQIIQGYLTEATVTLLEPEILGKLRLVLSGG